MLYLSIGTHLDLSGLLPAFGPSCYLLGGMGSPLQTTPTARDHPRPWYPAWKSTARTVHLACYCTSSARRSVHPPSFEDRAPCVLVLTKCE